MTVQQATAEVFFTAFKTLAKPEQEAVLLRIARDRKLHRILEDISDRLAIEEERPKPAKPLRTYIEERERKEQVKVKASK